MATSNVNRGKHEFISYHSGVADDGDCALTVGFSRDPADEDSIDGLCLQRGRGIQDDTPGIEGVYIEIPIQRHATYGGVTEAILRRASFVLRLNEHTARKMGGFHEIFVHFDLSSDEFMTIRDGLRYVFTDCPCYREEYDTAP